MKTAINSVTDGIFVFTVNTHSHYDTSSEKFNLCRVALQITISAYTQAAILVCSQGPELVMMETQHNIVAYRCSMIVQGPMDIFHRKLFYFYTVKMAAKPVDLPKFMISAWASSTPTAIYHAMDEEPYILKIQGHTSAQCDNGSTDPTVIAFYYKLQESHDELEDCHNSLKVLSGSSQTNWQKKLVIPDQYSAFRNKFKILLQWFESMWYVHLGSNKAVQEQIQLEKTEPNLSILLLIIVGRRLESLKTRNRSNARHESYWTRPRRLDVANRTRFKKDGTIRFCIDYQKKCSDDSRLIPPTMDGRVYRLAWRCSDFLNARHQ